MLITYPKHLILHVGAYISSPLFKVAPSSPFQHHIRHHWQHQMLFTRHLTCLCLQHQHHHSSKYHPSSPSAPLLKLITFITIINTINTHQGILHTSDLTYLSSTPSPLFTISSFTTTTTSTTTIQTLIKHFHHLYVLHRITRRRRKDKNSQNCTEENDNTSVTTQGRASEPWAQRQTKEAYPEFFGKTNREKGD